LAKQKRGRPPGRIPGLVMTAVHARCFTRRKDVTAKQQLAFEVKRFLRKTLLKA
jgi:hypothetical protein